MIENEAFIFWNRNPTPGLRFVRVTRWTGEAPPHRLSLVDAECLGWTLTNDGRCCRLFYVLTAPYDGARCWSPDHRRPDTPVDPASVRIKLPGSLPREQYSAPEVEDIERCHRQPVADHWAAWHANEAAVAKARAERQAKAEEAAERESLRVISTPRVQQTFLGPRNGGIAGSPPASTAWGGSYRHQIFRFPTAGDRA